MLRGDDRAAEDEEQADEGVGEGYGESWDVPEDNPFASLPEDQRYEELTAEDLFDCIEEIPVTLNVV